MNKFFIIVFIVLHSHMYGNCNILFNKYMIDPKTKSIRGWQRIIFQNSLKKYIRIPEELRIETCDTSTKIELSNCLVKHGFDINSISREIGKQR